MISSPTSPSCLEPGLPTHITRHCAVKKPSSQSTSTICPISNRTPPRNLKPRCELSTTRQGSLCARPLRLTIKLARFLMAVRFDRRPRVRGELSTDIATSLVNSLHLCLPACRSVFGQAIRLPSCLEQIRDALVQALDGSEELVHSRGFACYFMGRQV